MGAGLAMTVQNARRALGGTILCVGLGLLVGCGEDPSVLGLASLGKAAVGAASDVINGGDPEGVTATDAELRAFPRPLLKITQLDRNLDAVAGRVSDRPSGEIWQSADLKTLTLRDGILVATRGFGDDLMSSEEPSVRSGAASVLHDYFFIGGDELIYRTRFRCTLKDGGAQRIPVIGVAFDTRLIVEECTGPSKSFQNRYWIGTDGVIRRSQQWAGETTGPLLIEVVAQSAANRRAGPAPAGPIVKTQPDSGGPVVIMGQ